MGHAETVGQGWNGPGRQAVGRRGSVTARHGRPAPARRLALGVVDVECSICPRQGRYRLAGLAERYGAAIALDRLLEAVAVDCSLMKLGEQPRHYEARCGIRYWYRPACTPDGPRPTFARTHQLFADRSMSCRSCCLWLNLRLA